MEKAVQLAQEKSPLILLEEKRNELIELAKGAEGLTINGIDDKEGFQKVHAQEQKLVKARTSLNEVRLEYTRQFDQKKKEATDLEKELLALIAPAEAMLKSEKARIEQEKENIRIEAERKAKEKLNGRIAQLAEFGSVHDLFELEHMEEEVFTLLLSSAKSKFEEAKALKEKEEADRLKFEADKKALEEAQKKLAEDQQAVANAKAEQDRAAELKKAQEDSAEKARVETEARIKREAEEKAEKERVEREKLESEAKFKSWLVDNGVNETNKSEFKITVDENSNHTLWKKVSTYEK